MKLLRLYLNTGVFQNRVIDFTDNGKPQDLICLSGVNGSGKTTILDLILNLGWLLNPELSLRDVILYNELKPNIFTYTEFAQLDLLIDGKLLSLVVGDEDKIQRNPSYPQAFFIIGDKIKFLIKRFEDVVVKRPDGESVELDEEVRYNLLGEKKLNQEISKKNEEVFSDFLNSIKGSINESLNPQIFRTLPFVYLFPAHDRKILDIRYSFIPKDDTKYRVVDSYHSKRHDLKKLFVYYDYAYPTEFETLKNWVNRYVLEGKCIKKIHRPEFNVIIETKDGHEHSFELLSSGEESLLIIAIQLYLKALNHSIILIDEIDQSLHPEYQEKVMKIIKQLQQERKFQVVVSSHSRFIWNAFEEKSRIRLTEVVR